MLRVTAGIFSVIAGVAAAFFTIYTLLGWGGSSDQNMVIGFTIILSMFVLPLVAVALSFGLACLEALAILTKWPRALVILSGTLLIPLGVAMFIGMPYFALGAGHPRVLEQQVTSLWFGLGALIPSFVGCFLYALLTWPLNRTSTPPPAAPAEAAPAPPPPAPPPPPKPPSPFAPVVLSPAPDNHRVIEILTSPRHRIGQRHFMYAMQIWSMAATVWWGITMILMAAVGFDKELGFVIAAAGWFVLLWCAFCGTANRLHDFNLNGLLGLGPVFTAFAWVVSEPPPSDGWVSGPGIARCIIACVFCFGATAAILLVLKGEPYSNQYGPETQ